MFISSITTLLFSGLLASASVLPRPRSLNGRDTSKLTENDIIVYGDNGRAELWNKADYEELISTQAGRGPFTLTSAFPPMNETMAVPNTTDVASNNKLNTRCSSETVLEQNPVKNFLQWDVIMSSVVKATGATTLVSVSSGYTISNSISVSASADYTFIKDVLSASLSVSYDHTWTTSTTAAYTYTVPVGKYAAIVSNPTTTRNSGTIYSGCVGSMTGTPYSADSYSSQSYGNLAWVSGTISLCVGDTYPLPMCIGSGTLK